MSSLGKEYKIYDVSVSTAWHGTFWTYDRWMIVIAFLYRNKILYLRIQKYLQNNVDNGDERCGKFEENNQRNFGKRKIKINIFAFLIGP